MAIINESMNLIPQTTNLMQSGGAGVGSNPFVQQMIELLKEINGIINNPAIAQKFLGKQQESIPYQNPQTPPQQTNLNQIKAKEINESAFIDYMSTQKGREAIINGLKKVQDMFGDVKISEMIKLLKESGGLSDKSK